MAGLERADTRARIGDHHAGMLDDDVRPARLGNRRPRIGPDAFLTRCGLFRFGIHALSTLYEVMVTARRSRRV